MFSFLHPALLVAGIGCVSIPIILHFLRRRRKPVSWGAMRFLEQAYRKRKRILTIEQLILLATRCVLVVLIAIGIGGLVFGSVTQSNTPVHLTIIVDNSIGSGLDHADGVRSIDRSKRIALAQLNTLDAGRGDRATLFTLGAPASAVVLQPSTDLDTIAALIGSIDLVQSSADYPGVFELINAQDSDDDALVRKMVLASDFRGVSAQTLGKDTRTDGFASVHAPLPDAGARTNVGIESITPTRDLRINETATSLPINALITLTRSGDLAPMQSTITLIDAGSGVGIATGTHPWAQGQTHAETMVTIRSRSLSSIRAQTAAIIGTLGDDANPLDNSAACTLRIRDELRVGIIETESDPTDNTSAIRPSRALRSAISPTDSSPISLTLLDPARINPARLAAFDASIILSPNDLDDEDWEQIIQAHHRGMVIMIAPQASAPTGNWGPILNRFGIENTLDTFVPTTHEQPRALSDALPSSSLLGSLSSEYAPLVRSIGVTRSIDLGSLGHVSPIAGYADGAPFAVQSNPDSVEGTVIVFSSAFDLGWTDLPTRPFFVPFMQELVRQSIGRSTTIRPMIAGDAPAGTGRSALVHSSHHPFGNNASVSNALRHAGLYAQTDNDDAAIGLFVVNPDARGTQTTPASPALIADHLTRTTGLREIQWIANPDAKNPDAANPADTPPQYSRLPFAGIIFLCAAAIGLVELVLARVFSFKDEQNHAGSAA